MRRLLLALGLAYALVQPPFAASDEHEQLALLSELARFELTSPGDADGPFHQVDAALDRLASVHEPAIVDWEARTRPGALLADLPARASDTGTARWAQQTPRFGRLSNLPLLPGYWLGRALGLSPLAQLYLARLAGLVCFALLASYAVSRAGPLGFAFLALSALPASIAEAASVGGEGLCNGLALCFFALIGKGFLERERGLDQRERVALLALLLVLTACQPLFASAALFLLALPHEASVRPLLRGARLGALGALLGGLGVLIWVYTNLPAANASGGATFLREEPLAALLGGVLGVGLQVDSLLIALSGFGGVLIDQARFSAGLIAALGAELVLLLSWGGASCAARPQESRSAERWLIAGALVYALALSLRLQLTQASAGPLELGTICARSFALYAPVALLLLATRGKPLLLRYLSARPLTRVGLPLVLLNAVALSALIGRYYVPVRWAWPY